MACNSRYGVSWELIGVTGLEQRAMAWRRDTITQLEHLCEGVAKRHLIKYIT